MGVRCVRLPLAEYYPECLHRGRSDKRIIRIVLNINTLVEMIIAYSETHNWRETFERCIPIRKVRVTDETGNNFDYHNIKSVAQLEAISEYRINRYEMKHALHIFCEKHSIVYTFENRELSYDEYLKENVNEQKAHPFLRFEATVLLNGEVVGMGRGKSQRAAQGRASWYALVRLGEIQVEEESNQGANDSPENNELFSKKYNTIQQFLLSQSQRADEDDQTSLSNNTG